MSLRVRKIANSMTRAVNENVMATLKVSTGYEVSESGDQVPKYEEYPRELQLQSMESDELEHYGFANNQGLFMSAYADGMIDVLNRDEQLGTTIVETQKYGSPIIRTWQVVKIAESYNDWVKIIIRYTGIKP